jgi:hypothetical protein
MMMPNTQCQMPNAECRMLKAHSRASIRHSAFGIRHYRSRGAAAILAMMFLVIFSSLAAAMAIVAQGNMSTADTHYRANRAAAAAETGMTFVTYRLRQSASGVTTRDGIIDADNAPALWIQVRTAMLDAMTDNAHNVAEPFVDEAGVLQIGPIAVGPGEPTFTASVAAHPIAGENYGSSYYQRPPFDAMTPAVSVAAPLDATWVRVSVRATDGSITRTLAVDCRIDKKIPFAILSKSRVMIGQNVMIDGPIGSRFMETHLPGGHPIQMQSDFYGYHSSLDAALDALVAVLNSNDQDGDNRISLASSAETDGIEDPQDFDLNGDGYIDDYDYFLGQFDSNDDQVVTGTELDIDGNINAAQLLELIDTFGDPTRYGYDDGVIDAHDRYAKLRGEVLIKASLQSWNDGAAGGNIQNYYQGPVDADYGKSPLTFEAADVDVHDYGPADFDVSDFRDMATGDLTTQAETQAALHDPSDPDSPGSLDVTVFEATPYGAAHPYDYYDRPVFENMMFTNVRIPAGTNALFRNCTFVGVTFVETSSANTDPDFNYAGMVGADGTLVYPDATADVAGTNVTDTKAVSNNIRFDGCTFEGAVISDVPSGFTHVRNKLSFTGRTRFDIDDSPSLTTAEKLLFKRSTIMTPHYSVEMGTFIDPADAGETVELSGTIVAGVLDLRGNVKLTGTVLTTFEPISNTAPVLGETSPIFNTTLGYFASAAGDMENELPEIGRGVIQLVYDPTMPLPDGILGPIQIEPNMATYFEGGH